MSQRQSDNRLVPLPAYRAITALLVPGIPFVLMLLPIWVAHVSVVQRATLLLLMAGVTGLIGLYIRRSRFVLDGRLFTFKTLFSSKTINFDRLETVRAIRSPSVPRLNLRDKDGAQLTFPVVPYQATYQVVFATIRRHMVEHAVPIDPYTLLQLDKYR